MQPSVIVINFGSMLPFLEVFRWLALRVCFTTIKFVMTVKKVNITTRLSRFIHAFQIVTLCVSIPLKLPGDSGTVPHLDVADRSVDTKFNGQKNHYT